MAAASTGDRVDLDLCASTRYRSPTLARFGLPAHVHAQLHEFVTLCPRRCAGTSNLERMPWVQAYWQRSDPAWRDGEQAESFLDFAGRVRNVRRDLHDSQALTLVFGHGMFFAMWIWQELGFEVHSSAAMAAFRRFQLGLPMPNAGVYRLLREGTGWRLIVHAGRMSQLAAEAAPGVAIQ